MSGSTQTKRPLQPIAYLLFVLFLFTLTLAQLAFASAVHTMMAKDHLKGTLTNTHVSFNTSFSGAERAFSASTAPICADQTKCLKGLALVGFHSDTPLPFVDLASQNVVNDNPNFQRASDFETLAKNGGNTVSPTSDPQQTSGTNISPGFWVLIILALVLLELAFWGFPAMRRRRALKATLDDAERQAELMGQQIKVTEAVQRNWVEHNRVSEPPTIPVWRQGLQDTTGIHKTVSGLRCPNCGELFDRNATYCSNCHLALTSSESSPRLRVQPSTSSAHLSTVLTTRVVFDAAYIKADINVRQLMKQEG